MEQKTTIQRMIKKSVKKWARNCFKGKDVYKSLYKSEIIAMALNQKFKENKLTREDFKKWIKETEELNKNKTYTEYEKEFVRLFEENYKKYVKVENTTQKTE